MSQSADFYDRLGITADASDEEIRKSYREAARRLHPDVNLETGATELFLDIKEAFDVLSNPETRSVYDGKSVDVQPPPVRTNVHFSRKTVSWMAEKQWVYALINMDVLTDQLEKEDESSPPINIALVLDCSTSMQGERLDVVKASAIELIRKLRPQDIISIIAFHDRAETVRPAALHVNNLKSESRIRMLQAKGGTEIFQGLNAGVAEVQRNLSPYYINHIILITDGHTYGDENNCHELAQNARQQEIGISCLGIGAGWNDVFLDNLSTLTGGSSFYINDPRDINTLLRKKFNGLGQVYVDGISLNLRVGVGVTLNYAYRLQPEAGVLPASPPISLGNISKGAHLSILLEFLVSPIPPSVQQVLLADGSFTFSVPKLGKSTYRIPVTLYRPTSADKKHQPPPKIILKAMSRLTLYRMQEQARKEFEAGEYEEASTRLQNMATHLFATGEVELAKTVLIEAQNIQNRKKFSKEGQKRIKYGTRALISPPVTPVNRKP
jgi:Ca-activated chloride channel family protein